MNNDVIIYLPWPPSVNNYYKTGRHGQRYLHHSVRDFRAAVAECLSEQCPGLTLDDRLFVEVYLHPPTRRACDIDNYMKGLLDALTEGGLWEDDKLIDQLHIYRGEIVKGGSVKIEVSEAGPLIPADTTC